MNYIPCVLRGNMHTPCTIVSTKCSTYTRKDDISIVLNKGIVETVYVYSGKNCHWDNFEMDTTFHSHTFFLLSSIYQKLSL